MQLRFLPHHSLTPGRLVGVNFVAQGGLHELSERRILDAVDFGHVTSICQNGVLLRTIDLSAHLVELRVQRSFFLQSLIETRLGGREHCIAP